MITAKEAKELYDQSGAEVEQFLKNSVEKPVTDAANGGKRHVFIHLGCVPNYRHLFQEITPLQKAAREKLNELGYRVEIKLDGESYVPLGLTDNDGYGPTVQNYGIQIGW